MSSGIFISYRREDSAGFAGRIYDRLLHRFERERIFFDIDNIEPGLDFTKIISDRVGACDAVVAIIGKDWLPKLRPDAGDDFVRIEIETALERDIRVIPVLVGGAKMPSKEELPNALKSLARRQSIEISHERFDSDTERLITALINIEHSHHEYRGSTVSNTKTARTKLNSTKGPSSDNNRYIYIKRRGRLINWSIISFVALASVLVALAAVTDFGGGRDYLFGGEFLSRVQPRPGFSAPTPTPTPTVTSVDLLVNFSGVNSAEISPPAKQNLAQFALALKDKRIKGDKFEIDAYALRERTKHTIWTYRNAARKQSSPISPR